MVCKDIEIFSIVKRKVRFFVILAVVFPFCGVVTAQNDYRAAYISRFRAIAIAEQRQHGIPASIIMAQAILETGFGTSRVCRVGHNHFGVTANQYWKGDTVVDGRVTYRRYISDEASFRDHSRVLKSKYYTSIHGTDPADYKAWAHGIKNCGYAEDPEYAPKLIRIIEAHNLNALTLEAMGKAKSSSQKPYRPTPPQPRMRFNNPGSPDNPGRNTHPAIEREFQPKRAEQAPKQSQNGKHEVKKKAGVSYVVAGNGDSYYRIAEEFGLNFVQLLRLNDIADREATLLPNQVVYLEAKNDQVRDNRREHKVRASGDTLWRIAQLYAVKLATLAKLNDLPNDARLQSGTVIKLK